MSRVRTPKKLHPALRDDIGDLVTRRPLPGPGLDQLDPFLFLNHHGPQVYPPRNGGLPFGPHPHRGFETVTFILEGSLAHRDTGGGAGIETAGATVIGPGGVQWMTAGRGLVHSELSPEGFVREGGPLEILQLWVNLPARLKMTAPRYVGLQRESIPELSLDGGRVKVSVVSGELGGARGPVESLTGVRMTTVALAAEGRLEVPVAPQRTVFLYVVRGTVEVAGTRVPPHHLVELDGDGDGVALAAAAPALALLGDADPLGEPVVAHGPFVMNTPEEIHQAIRDYQAGRFGG